MGLNDINSLSQSLPLRVYKKELQISHRVCAKVSAKGILSGEESSNRKDLTTAMRMERGTDYRSGSVPGSYPSAGRNSAEDVSIKFYGISEGKEQHDAI